MGLDRAIRSNENEANSKASFTQMYISRMMEVLVHGGQMTPLHTIKSYTLNNSIHIGYNMQSKCHS